jgi:hypothetical protein
MMRAVASNPGMATWSKAGVAVLTLAAATSPASPAVAAPILEPRGGASLATSVQPVAPPAAPGAGEAVVPRSPRIATALALAGTLVPLALVVAGTAEYDAAITADALVITGGLGLAVGPSSGHFYVGQARWRQLAMRCAGISMLALGLDRADRSGESGEIMFAVGAASLVVGVAWDIATASAAANAYNARARTAARVAARRSRATDARSSLVVAPMVAADAAGSTRVGVAVVGDF